MGWTSGDMKQQLTIRFTPGIRRCYCERGHSYQVIEPKEPARRQAAHADTLFPARRTLTHQEAA